MNVHVAQSSEQSQSDSSRYAKLSLPDLQINLDRAKAAEEAAAQIVEDIQAAIEKRVEESAKAARQLADKETGSIHVAVDGCDVKHTIPKTVKWDTPKLLNVAAQLSTENIDPYQYIDFKLSIPERSYDTLPLKVKQLVRDARTEKHGKPQIVVTVPESK